MTVKKIDINTNNAGSFGWKTDEPAAFQSLRSALIAYFETYHSTLQTRPILPLKALNKRRKFEIDEYKTLYFTTITHFQHFFEFVLKDSLERINPILAAKFDKGFKNIYLAQKRSRGHSISTESYSIEFSEALNRLEEIKKIDLKNAVIVEINFLLKNAETLRTLNLLRNRIWHRSLFFLRYHNLDLFIGRQILPLVIEIMKLSRYSNQKWKYQQLACKIDPIDEILRISCQKRPSFEKIGLLKEMGRAAYENPLVMMNDRNSGWFRAFNHDKVMESKVKVDAVCKEFFYTDVFECPVCGQNTLIKHEYSEWVDGEDADGNECPFEITTPDKLFCENCSFYIKDNITKLSLINIKKKKFWDKY